MTFIRRQWRAKSAIVRTAQQVRAQTGKGVAAQLYEITRLRFGPGKLQASDYFTYAVYDDQRFSRQGKFQVLSWHPARIADALNDPAWRAICDDKLACYGMLRGLGLPFPEIYGAFTARERAFGDVPTFSIPSAVASFLRDGARYPFFAKPIGGGYGTGASSVTAYDCEQDQIALATGEAIGVDEYVRRYVAPAQQGYLFQEPVRQHALIDQLTGGRVGTLRMIVLNGADGARLFRVVWRVPVGRNITDNFLHGTQGNLIAQVDRGTGRVGTVIQVGGAGPAAAGGGHRLGREVPSHPDTGERITGITIPMWAETVSTCLRAASSFPGLGYQSWDVAIGATGPLLLELNYRGDFGLSQVPGTPGFYDAEFSEFWSRYGRPR